MRKDNTDTLSVITSAVSTVFFSLLVSTSASTMTTDVVRNEQPAYQEEVLSKYAENELINSNSSLCTIIPETLQNNLVKIDRISSLKDDWNGNGAKAFSPGLIDLIRHLLFSLMIQPEIFPTAADSIQLEYEGPNGSYLEIEINESKIAEVFRINRDKSEEFFAISMDIYSINKLVASFYD